MVVLLGLSLIYACESEGGSTTTRLAFYSTADPYGLIDVYIDGDFEGQIDDYSTSSLVDCEAPSWPKTYLGVGTYSIEYFLDGSPYASQSYTVSQDQLGGCIPILAYP